MFLEVQVQVDAPKEAVWRAITDIENAPQRISGIEAVEILEKPDSGFVGLKWRETRTMMGKTATEVMWITESVENESYVARAESHGFVYLSTLSVADQDGGTLLRMTHDSAPQGFGARLMSIPMLLFKGAMKKMIQKDLDDIKADLEGAGA